MEKGVTKPEKVYAGNSITSAFWYILGTETSFSCYFWSLNWVPLAGHEDVFKRSEHTAQKVRQFSTLWLNQVNSDWLKETANQRSPLWRTVNQPKAAKLACLGEQKLSHTRTPS